MSYLLDTHILAWWFLAPERLTRRQAGALSRASASDPLLVSEITLWEIALAHERRRIELDMPLRDWLEHALAAPLVARCRITSAVAAEVAALPRSFHRDPADRIIVATARVQGATLLTSDQKIIDAALVPTLS